MDTHGQHLAETFLEMINTHNPDLVDRFVAEDYRQPQRLRPRRTRGKPPVLDRVLRRHLPT